MELFEEEMPTLGEEILSFPWNNPYHYVQFLSQTYYYVKHSTPLLGRALRKMDSSAPVMKDRFLEHTKEEKGHQYLVVDDLRHFGLTPESIPEHSETTEFYKLQYDYINKHGSTSLFGYILQLEGIAWKFGDEVCSQIIRTHGEGAAHFMKVHSGNEIDHVNSALSMVNNLPEEKLIIVAENFTHSCKGYIKMLRRAKIAPEGTAF